MATCRREVLRGRLLHRTRKGASWKKRLVVVYCGNTQSSDQQTSAQVSLFEDYENHKAVEKPNQKPKKSINLLKAKIDTTSSLSGSATGSPPHSGSSPMSPSQGAGGNDQHLFVIVVQNDTFEFRTDSENERLRWVKLLGLLVMFPYSVIPEEPGSNPIKHSLRAKQDPQWYGADSVWTVYILPEEVGSRCHIIGTNVVCLKSGVPRKSVGRLEIINPADPHNPIVSWDRDKMRRTGKTGNLVFIEIGRRCEGGPGLVWMYAGFDEAQALRETLHKFLFQGDGKAVAIPTHQTGYRIYDVPRPSYDTSLPPSYQKRGSCSSGSYQVPRRHSLDPDSGNPASPQSFGNSPRSLEGPPVRLDKHPSIRRKQRYDVVRSPAQRVPSNPSSHYEGDFSNASVDSSLDEGVMFGETHSRSVTPPDDDVDHGYGGDDSIAGTMDLDSTCEFGVTKRSYSEPPARAKKMVQLPGRSHSTASSIPATSRNEYETMVHPNAGMYDTQGYVYMRPTEMRAQAALHQSNPIPFQRSHSASDVPQQQTEVSASPRKPPSLPTISEKQQTAREDERPSDYENFPLPQEMQKAAPVYYQPTYENVSLAKEGRRGSQERDKYENVTLTGEQIRTDTKCLQKRASLRRQRSTKEDVILPPNGAGPTSISGKEHSPPKNGMAYPYAEIHHAGPPKDRSNSTVKDTHYSSIDFQSATGVGKTQNQHLATEQRTRELYSA